MEGSGHQALCHTSDPCFSVHHYHQNHDKKANRRQITPDRSRENSPCPRCPVGIFPDWRDWGDWGLQGFFSPLTQNFMTKCCTFCSCFFLFCLWEITLEGSGNFNSCFLFRIGRWSSSALFLRKGAGAGRVSGARQKTEYHTEHFLEHLVHLQKGLCYLKGFEHVCACVWAIAARRGLEVGTKGRKKNQGQLEKSELSEKAEGLWRGAQCWLEAELWKSGGRRLTASRHS